MNGTPTPPVLVDFNDRRTGLIVFGILQIVLGVLAALMIPLMILTQIMSANFTHQPVPVRQIIPGVFLYGVIAGALITLGFGSCKRRRWARALTLVMSWSWLLIGAFTTLSMAFVLKTVLNATGRQMAESARVGLIISFLFITLFMVLVPLALLFFYQSRHVKATCEAYDMAERWTDRCPLPVLALSLWTALGAATLLVQPLSAHGVLPVFGRLLSGVGGSLCSVGLALVLGYCAYGLYRLRSIAWWISLVSICTAALSAWMTFSRIDPLEMYRAMGYSEQQVQQMQQFMFLQRHMGFLSVASAIPMLALLLFMRPYFRSAGPGDTQSPGKKRFAVLGLGLLVLVVASLVFPHARQVVQPPQRLWSACFSPDGDMLVTSGGSDSPDSQPQGGELVLWDAKTGEKKRIIGQEWAVRSAAFSPDGKFIAMSDFGGMTKLLDPTTGKVS